MLRKVSSNGDCLPPPDWTGFSVTPENLAKALEFFYLGMRHSAVGFWKMLG